jgi:hypothetical protein
MGMVGLANADTMRPGVTRIDRAEAPGMARALLANGQAPAALDLAMGLLQADPHDPQALVLISQIERVLGRFDRARDAGQAAWVYAARPDDKFAAAVVTAQAHVSAKNWTRAQFWLRRSAQFAPDANTSAMVARDFATLRQTNPLSFQLGFNLTPSSNVNNGSSHATTTFAGIPFVWQLQPEGRALSGMEISGQAGLRYRIKPTARAATFLDLGFYLREVVLSPAARAFAADAEAGDLAFAQVSLGISRSWLAKNDRDTWVLGAAIAAGFSAHEPYAQTASLRLERGFALSDRNRLSAALMVEHTAYVVGGGTDAAQIDLQWQHKLQNGDGLSFGLGANETVSARVAREFTSQRLSVRYDLGEIMPAFDLALSYEIEAKTFPFSGVGGARNDLRHSLRADLGLRKVKLYGFEPVISAEAARNISNVDLYDTAGVRLGLGLRSSF